MAQQKAQHFAEIAELFVGFLERLAIKTATIASKAAEAEATEIANSDSGPEENEIRGVYTAAEANAVAEHVRAIAMKLIDVKVKAKAAAKAEGLATTLGEREEATEATANVVREAQNATETANKYEIYVKSKIRQESFRFFMQEMFSDFYIYDDYTTQQSIHAAKEALEEALNAAKPNAIFAIIVEQGIELVYDIFDNE